MIDSILAPDLSDPALVLPPLVAERLTDGAAVDAFIDRVFGPGRYAKTAERLREGNTPLLSLSFTCRRDGALIGCVRQWPILIGEAPAIFLGPFAVDPDERSLGLGAALVERACEAARARGHGLVLLIGAADYFSRLGFEGVPVGRLVMPGPIDPRRLLWRALTPGASDGLAGAVRIPPR